MAQLLVIGAVAADQAIRLAAPFKSGDRLAGRTLGWRLGGGGANASVALRRAGHGVHLVSVVEEGAERDRSLALLAGAGVDLSRVIRRSHQGGETVIFIDPDGERTILRLDGPLVAAPPAIVPPDDDPRTADGLLIRSAYPGTAAWAARVGGPVVLHWPAPAYDGRTDVVVASAGDLAAAGVGAPFAEARSRLGEGLRWVVVTEGAAGARVLGDDGFEALVSAPGVRPVDATGAGDAFAAGLLEALVAGAGIRAAVAHGCTWGAAAVMLESSAPLDAPPQSFRGWSAA